MDDQVDQKRMKPTTASGKKSISLKRDQSESEDEEDYSFESDQLEFSQLSTTHGHSSSSVPADKKELVIVSHSELPQPVQAQRKTVLLPQPYLSLYQRVLHRSLLYHDHKETADHHRGLCTIQQENHLAAVMRLPIFHHQQ